MYERARASGFIPVAHAGEEGPPQYISDALDLLKVRRIDHGVAAIHDPALQRRLAEEQVPLTMCPLSNLELKVTPDLTQHPLKKLLDAGLLVTVNSDDPAYFGGYLLANYLAVQKALGLSRADLAQLARNSITASLLPAARKAELITEIDQVAAGAEGAPQAVTPPSTTIVRPVTKLPSSLARKATAAASSSGRPIRPSGYSSSIPSA